MINTGIVILAAGSGSRLGFSKPKALVPLANLALLSHILEKLPKSCPCFLIINPADTQHFEAYAPQCALLYQEIPKGTAHAITENLEHFKHLSALIVLNADTPLISSELINQVLQQKPDSLVGVHSPNHPSFGQMTIVGNQVTSIIEASDRESNISDTCYAGIMKLSAQSIQALTNIQPSPMTGEYYLTKIVSENRSFSFLIAPFHEVCGINTPQELIQAETMYRQQVVQRLLNKGCHIACYQSMVISPETQIGESCTLDAQVTLQNRTIIGKNCHIGQGSILKNVQLADNVTIMPYSILTDCHIQEHTTIGPMAHIYQNTHVGKHCHIGNFVELKRSTVQDHVKAKHLAYLGDSNIGCHVNIGAGVISCNFTPWKPGKQITQIQDHAFIGANCTLIAPIKIGRSAICAAGSTISLDIQKESLAICRAKPVIKESWRPKITET